MKVTIIGSGSTYGVPTVGGDWGTCDPNNPKNKRTVASIVVESDTTKILIDMSPDFLEQSVAHKVTSLDAILFTHGHADHILGNYYLPRLLQYHKDKDLPLYADLLTQQEIEHMFHFQIDTAGQSKFSYGGKTHFVTIKPYENFTVGDLEIEPLLQEHGDRNSFGFRIDNFAYSTDLNDFPEETWARLHGLDAWIIECNRKNTSDNSEKHMYLGKVLQFVERIKPKRVYLTHTGNTMDYDDINKILPPHVRMAYDGLELKF